MPPESSQKRSPLDDGLLLATIWRATSTVSRGMQESGTGTATHSSRGLGTEVTFER
jgi:hypothetical protein